MHVVMDMPHDIDGIHGTHCPIITLGSVIERDTLHYESIATLTQRTSGTVKRVFSGP